MKAGKTHTNQQQQQKDKLMCEAKSIKYLIKIRN
jgi:hypothetical protein